MGQRSNIDAILDTAQDKMYDIANKDFLNATLPDDWVEQPYRENNLVSMVWDEEGLKRTVRAEYNGETVDVEYRAWMDIPKGDHNERFYSTETVGSFEHDTDAVADAVKMAYSEAMRLDHDDLGGSIEWGIGSSDALL